MENQIVEYQDEAAMPQKTNEMYLDVALFEQAQRVAKMLASSTMIPEHFRGNVGNCMIALNFATRANLDPFMVLQSMYVVHGKPGLEGKLAIALLNKSKMFSPLQYRFDGEGDNRSCTAYATRNSNGEVCEQTVTWKMVVAEGWNKGGSSKWNTIPELMFQYRSASFFIKVHAPEILLGMQTKEELDDINQNPRPQVSSGSLGDKLRNVTPKEKPVEQNKPNPLHETPAWKEWVSTRDDFPDITKTWPDPVDEKQCTEAIRAVGRAVDSQNAA